MSPRRAPRSGGILAGRFAGEEDVQTLLEALDLFPGARIVIAGAVSQNPYLHGHPRVTLLGQLGSEALRARMQEASYLVFPALRCEPMPRIIVKAFSCGLPVIAAGIARVAELIEPGRNGLLFAPGSARELARRLAWAEAFPERMRQMGECAQADYRARFAADWSWARLFGERRRQARAAV